VQSLNITVMITELPLSLSVNSFERTIDYAQYTNWKAALNISANGPSRDMVDIFNCFDTSGAPAGNAGGAGTSAAEGG
jgi:hypothetical protein